MAKAAGPDALFEVAARDAVARRAPALLEHIDGLRARDPEAVHQTRVAARRLRATLEVFAPAFRRARTGGSCAWSRTPPTRSATRATSTSRSAT